MDTTNKDSLIERYLAAVTDLLPAKLRQDTVTEIRSLIQDALDDRSKTEGRSPDDEMVAKVLKQFGPPEKIVAPYLPEKYLIGPRLFPTFLLVLRIALPIIAVLTLIGFWAGTSYTGQTSATQFFTDLANSIGDAFTSVIGAFGNIVLIFAILQWAVPEFRLPTKEKEWDPYNLKAISQPDKVKRGELIIEIIFILAALIIFNFYLDKVGIYNNYNGQWSFTPILTPAFNAYIPWLDLFWVLSIVLNVLLLRKGAWETGTRLFSIGMSAFNIGIAAIFMTHIQYVYTLQGALGQLGAEGIVQSVVNQILIVAFAISIIVSAAKIVRMGWHLVKGKV